MRIMCGKDMYPKFTFRMSNYRGMTHAKITQTGGCDTPSIIRNSRLIAVTNHGNFSHRIYHDLHNMCNLMLYSDSQKHVYHT